MEWDSVAQVRKNLCPLVKGLVVLALSSFLMVLRIHPSTLVTYPQSVYVTTNDQYMCVCVCVVLLFLREKIMLLEICRFRSRKIKHLITVAKIYVAIDLVWILFVQKILFIDEVPCCQLRNVCKYYCNDCTMTKKLCGNNWESWNKEARRAWRSWESCFMSWHDIWQNELQLHYNCKIRNVKQNRKKYIRPKLNVN